ncbi:MAG: hypothetical protein IMW91_02905 [Firmicutes bacterium]|nr:hypothetical protein [Bacillota bacterium]
MRIKRKRWVGILLIGTFLGLTGCGSAAHPQKPPQQAPPPAPKVHYEQVAPIFAQRCMMCHGPNGIEAQAPLTSYEEVLRFVSPGDAESWLVLKTQPGGSMNERLTAQEAALIRQWVTDGALR